MLGYAVTTFFVLNRRSTREPPLPDRASSAAAAGDGPDKVAVLYYIPAEPETYDIAVLAEGMDTRDYRQGLPPVLLRPLYLSRVKTQYAAHWQQPGAGHPPAAGAEGARSAGAAGQGLHLLLQ